MFFVHLQQGNSLVIHLTKLIYVGNTYSPPPPPPNPTKLSLLLLTSAFNKKLTKGERQ